MQDEKLVATISGVVERVNKLISVRPLKSRCLHKPLPPHLFSLFTFFLELISSCAPAPPLPLANRYTGEVGDVVVGRIKEVRVSFIALCRVVSCPVVRV